MLTYLTANKSKHLLFENEFKKLKAKNILPILRLAQVLNGIALKKKLTKAIPINL